ncbi:polygalacturonase-like [Durio zibethinus]|uniref:endo-polygalacturonase n=1 Tax=Durio zibethinus TaxID=66656 RepID=A0A6P6API2_DURZI|nr:polygalacturonase-like [Durio zibethinus]
MVFTIIYNYNHMSSVFCSFLFFLLTMKLQRHLFSSIIIFFSLFSTYYLGEVSGYNAQAHANPSYFSSIWDGKLKGFFKQTTRGLTLHRFDDNRENFSSLPAGGGPTSKTVSVDDFGAKGDGTDDTEAFEKAWEQVCSSPDGVTFVVPKGKSYRLKPVRFTGPCKSNLRVEIYGTIEASDDQSDYNEDSRHWLVFDSVENLVVEGGGTINGNGQIWWENSCKRKKDKPCKGAPTALTFYENQHLVVNNLKIQDAQQIHVSFDKCVDVQASNLVVTAPGDSPNTDGIHVTKTQNILIESSTIGTGDDCISIVNGSQKVQVHDITCGPGHGISIGSLGENGSREYVSGVIVNGAKISGTSNGVRIKTWQGGSGSANNIRFVNVEMNNVTNPIIIDQNYCDQDEPCKEQPSAVQVQNVVYQNIHGTSASDVAIDFDCSKSHPCQGITLQNVNLKGEENEATTATCNDVQTITIGNVYPACSSKQINIKA